MPDKKVRVVIIGLDGVPYELIRDLAAKGVMPVLNDLFCEGALFKMASSVPAVSSVAWSTVITGENSGVHGIFGFTDVADSSYRLVFPNFANLKATPFWEQKLFGRSVILNVPSTYPARPMNGVHIAGFVAPDLGKAVYPPALVERLRSWGYEVDVDASTAHQSMELFLRKLNQTLEARTRTALALLEEPWDTFMAVFTGTDRLLHFLWPAVTDSGHPYHQEVVEYFQSVDRSIGQLIECLKGDEALVMLSDHGFEGMRVQINVNRFLLENGFLAFRQAPPRSLNDLAEESVAFALDPARIYLHREGRYPRGKVRKDQEEKVLQQLEKAFSELQVEGRPVVARIYRKEELYRGPETYRGPDLVLVPAEGVEFKAGLRAETVTEPATLFRGKHRGDNAFLFVRALASDWTVSEAPSVEDVKAVLVKLREAERA